MRKEIIAGNWKMNSTLPETEKFLKEIEDKIIKKEDREVVLCVPFTELYPLSKMNEKLNISVGAQNVYFEDSGAYTGEISADMLKALDVKYVIVGHSERREYFNETNEIVNKKIKKLLEKNLYPILCVGETLEIREKGNTINHIQEQLKNSLADITAQELENIVIAYEPIWAIGTGKTASPEQAQEVCMNIRNILKDRLGDVADRVTIQYGGSVKPDNIREIMEKRDIDGVLVGGASLKADSFLKLVEYK